MAASILVVDDDEGIRELLRLQLSAAGYEVNVAEDAIAAGDDAAGRGDAREPSGAGAGNARRLEVRRQR